MAIADPANSPKLFLTYCHFFFSISKAVFYIRPHFPSQLNGNKALWPSILCSAPALSVKQRNINISSARDQTTLNRKTGAPGIPAPPIFQLLSLFLLLFPKCVSTIFHQFSPSGKKTKQNLENSNFHQLHPPVEKYYSTVMWNWTKARSRPYSLWQGLWGKSPQMGGHSKSMSETQLLTSDTIWSSLSDEQI